MGNIVLKQTSTTLQEVVVKTPPIRRDADRIVLNVAANPLSANKDAQELLKVPSASIATIEIIPKAGAE